MDQRIVGHLILAFVMMLSAGIAGVNAVAVATPETGEPINGETVVTNHDPNPGILRIYGSDGSVVYENDTHDGYWDVDQIPNTQTLIYTTSDKVNASDSRCELDNERANNCVYQRLVKWNRSTDERTVLYTDLQGQYKHSEWHDADRINSTHYVIADMFNDDVIIVNTVTDEVTYRWHAESVYDRDSNGGPYPYDWTHLNDVEVLDNGRIMVSIRNMDEVIFIQPGVGVLEQQTIGDDDAHSIQYEQHNPDYIPEERGGPAVVIADSENNRLVEYQRTADGWSQSWVWQTAAMQWPRDADRLPNGHTLVADTLANRIIQINQRGEIVWEQHVRRPYEVERLSTPPESGGGASAERLGLTNITSDADLESESTPLEAKLLNSMFPSKVVNGSLNVSPGWVNLQILWWVFLSGLSGLLMCFWEASVRLTS